MMNPSCQAKLLLIFPYPFNPISTLFSSYVFPQNLTGKAIHITDSSNASRTQFMDLKSQAWSPKLCEFFGIDMDILPEIKSSAEVYGKVKEGPLAGVEIAGILGDQMAALVGNKVSRERAS